MSDMLYYILCGVLVLGVLLGIAMMSRVKNAAAGNMLSAVCTAMAIVLTLVKYGLLSGWALYACMALGLIPGLVAAMRVRMIDMPQVVAMLNGFGGAASALVALVSMLDGYSMDAFGLVTAGLALAVGVITLVGSFVAAGKLHKLLPQRPIVWPAHKGITAVSLVAALACVCAMPFASFGGSMLVWLAVGCVAFSALFGVAFAVRVGGADMPITISLLNSLSGVAGAIAGMAIGDPLLVAIGGVVGASGLLLTQIMCRAMNRSLPDILLGKTTMGAGAVGSGAALVDESAQSETSDDEHEAPLDAQGAVLSPTEALAGAKSVIIVPGYGMAIAQAQGQVKQLADKLAARGAVVKYAIHPVAGRMPGHMNVLLCEVDVPYEELHEMDDINPEFAKCDVVVVVGANDVVNPAANTAEGTPIYGMPILSIQYAPYIIFCNFDLKPGYAGVNNPLYTKKSGVAFMAGDAKDSLEILLQVL